MLNREQAPADAFLEHSTEAVFAVDRAGFFQQANARFASLLGLPAAHLLGTALRQHLPEAEADRIQHHLDRVAAGEVVCYESGLPGMAGLSLCLLPLLADGRITGIYGVAKALGGPPAPAALVEREHHLSVLFATIADVTFVLDVVGEGRYRFAFVNRAFEKTTGLPMARVVGSFVSDIIPEPSLSLVLEKYRQAIATGQRMVWLEVSDYPTGQVTGEVSVTPVFNEAGQCRQLVGTVHDLTEQKRAEEALRVSNERFQYALKATTDVLYDWNIAADTLYWGEGYEELFGHRLAQNPAPFRSWSDYVDEQEHERVVAGLRHTAYETETSFWQQEYRFRRASGAWAVVFDRGYILRDAQGRPVRMIGAMQDITGRKEAEERQRLLAEQLVRQNAGLQQFTYIISHNLRAPLANALGFADLLGRLDHSTPVFDTSLKNLLTSIRRLDEVVTDVNEILAVRDAQDGYREEPVAVAAVCRQALAGLQEQLLECGGELHATIAEELRLLGSRAYLHSIFHNLISNAIKYRSETRPLRINIGAVDGGQTVVITVSDNGSGFEQGPDETEIFQLYRRFHLNKPGRGIGLFLVKSHVESMGGQISVRSRPNEGTHFSLSFRNGAD